MRFFEIINSKSAKNLMVFFTLIVLVTLFYYPIIYKGEVIGSKNTFMRYSPWSSIYGSIKESEYVTWQSDITQHYYPWKNNLYNSIQHNTIPYWDRHTMSGQSNLAIPYSGLFYPFNYLKFGKNWIQSDNYKLVIEHILLCIMLFLIARAMTLSRIASIISSGITGFSVIIGGNVLPWDHSSIFWLIVAFYCLIRYLKQSDIKWIYYMALFCALSILSGHLEFVLFYSILFLILSITYYYYNYEKNTRIYRNYITLFTVFSTFVLLSVILSSVSLVPFLSLDSVSQRSTNISGGFTNNFPPLTLLTFLSNHLFGVDSYFIGRGFPFGVAPQNPRSSLYCGIIAIPLILSGLLCAKSSFSKAICASFYISIFLCFCGAFLQPVLKFFPFISGMRGLNRMNIFFPVLLGLIAGFGIDALKDKPAKYVWLKWRRISIVLLGTGLLINGIRLIFMLFNKQLIIEKLKIIFIDSRKLDMMYNWLSGGSTLYEQIITILAPLFLNLLLLILIYNNIDFYSSKLKSTVLAIIITFELIFSSSIAMYYIEPEDLFPVTPGIIVLKDLIGLSSPPYRAAGIRIDKENKVDAVAPFRMLEYYEIEHAGGYSSVYYKHYREFIGAIEHPEAMENLMDVAEHSISFDGYKPPLFNYLAAKYILTVPGLIIDELKHGLIYRGTDLWIYENNEALPRIFFSENISPYSTAQELFGKMLSSDFDPFKTVLVDIDYFQNNKNLDYSNTSTDKINSMSLIKYTPNVTELEVKSEKAQFLVFLDNYVPGWECYINGSKVDIGRAFNTFQVIKLKKGVSNIRMTYSPPNFKIGVALNIFGLLAFIFLIVRRHISTRFNVNE